MPDQVMINRAPVLTLWGAVVAERMGYERDAALTFGKCLAGLNAQSKGRMLGIYGARKGPDGGPLVMRMGKSVPRTYWQKYWIQLYREIVSWLKPAERKAAAARLKKLDVVCTRRVHTA